MNYRNQRGGAEAQRNLQSRDRRSPISNLQKRWWVIALIFITLLSAGLRFYKLNQLPPGLWFDEAWSAVAARNTAVSHTYPVYYAANFGGMHPAIVYLTRLANVFSAGHPLTIRYALAAVGTLSTILAFFSYNAIFKLTGSKNNLPPATCHLQLALLASLILTITFPFLLFTRIGFESSLVTPVSLILFWIFAIAIQKNKTRWYILTGLILGLTLYSFDTARFLPFAITIAYWGIAFIHRRAEGWRHHFLNFLWLTIASITVFIPLGSYYLRHWDQFTERAGITTYNTLGPGADSVPLAILSNIGHTLAGLILPNFGDMIARHNLPGRPVYDPFLAILLILGLVTLIRYWKRPSSIILSSWAGVMLIPVILTDGAPTYTRIFGAIPALAAITALSLETFNKKQSTINNQKGTKKFTIHNSQFTIHNLPLTIYHLLLTILIVLSIISTTRDYFSKWASLPQLFDDFQVADWQTAVFAQDQLATHTVYLTPNQIDEAHPTFDLVLHNTDIRTFPANCLVLPTESTQPVTYIIKNSTASETLSTLQTIFPDGQLTKQITSPRTGEKFFTAFTTTNNQQLTINNQQPTAQFANTIHLIPSSPQPLIPPAPQPPVPSPQSPITIPLTWQASSTTDQNHTYFLHLYRAGAEDQPPVAQLDQQPCVPTSQWHEGDIVLDTAVFNLPHDLPPGTYTLGLGWYTWPTFERLPLTASSNPLPNERHQLGQITIDD